MGERVHLANPDISLETFVMDVVNTILYNIVGGERKRGKEKEAKERSPIATSS